MYPLTHHSFIHPYHLPTYLSTYLDNHSSINLSILLPNPHVYLLICQPFICTGIHLSMHASSQQYLFFSKKIPHLSFYFWGQWQPCVETKAHWRSTCHEGKRNTISQGRKAGAIGNEEWKMIGGLSNSPLPYSFSCTPGYQVSLCEGYARAEINCVGTLTQLGKRTPCSRSTKAPRMVILLHNQASYTSREYHYGKGPSFSGHIHIRIMKIGCAFFWT